MPKIKNISNEEYDCIDVKIGVGAIAEVSQEKYDQLKADFPSKFQLVQEHQAAAAGENTPEANAAVPRADKKGKIKNKK